jgi:hypothetical protein
MKNRKREICTSARPPRPDRTQCRPSSDKAIAGVFRRAAATDGPPLALGTFMNARQRLRQQFIEAPAQNIDQHGLPQPGLNDNHSAICYRETGSKGREAGLTE